MLTNRHVVQGYRRITVYPLDDKPYPASVLALSEDYDLAAIKVDGYVPKAFVPVRAAAGGRYVSIPGDAEVVMTGGFSNADKLPPDISIVNGVVVWLEGYRAEGFTSVMVSSVRQGASGSPVVDYSGNLVGVVYSGVEHLDKPLSGLLQQFDSAVFFHNNNAVADFLTKEKIQFSFREVFKPVSRFEVAGGLPEPQHRG